MEYINPLTGVIAILAISIIDGVVKGIKGRREKLKNPPPVQPVRRSRRQKSGFSILIDGFFKVDKELTRLTNRCCYFNDPKYNRRRKKRW